MADKHEITINVQGGFTYDLYREFRDAYRDAPMGTAYTLNLHKADYMDSSALGMLLVLREHAGGDSAKITINGCCGSLRKVFMIARFDELFKII